MPKCTIEQVTSIAKERRQAKQATQTEDKTTGRYGVKKGKQAIFHYPATLLLRNVTLSEHMTLVKGELEGCFVR